MKRPALTFLLQENLKAILSPDRVYAALLDELGIVGHVEPGCGCYMVTDHHTGRIYSYYPEVNELVSAGIGPVRVAD